MAEEPTGIVGAPDRLSAAVHDADAGGVDAGRDSVAFGDSEGRRREAALAVLDVGGIDVGSLDPSSAPGRSAQAMAPLIEAAAVSVDERGWADQCDAALIAHGRAQQPCFQCRAGDEAAPGLAGLRQSVAPPEISRFSRSGRLAGIRTISHTVARPATIATTRSGHHQCSHRSLKP